MLQPLKWFQSLSRAARITGLFSSLLVVLTLVAWFMFRIDPARVAWGDYMTLGRAGLMLLWLSLTTLATYYAIRHWLQEAPAPEDDVELAWQAGLRGLSQVGLSMHKLPVFLMLGAHAIQQQRQLLVAAKQPLLVDAPAASNAPIHWFASEQAIYLCCNSAGVLGTTVQNVMREGPSEEYSSSASSFSPRSTNPCSTDPRSCGPSGCAPSNDGAERTPTADSGGTVVATPADPVLAGSVQPRGGTATLVKPGYAPAQTELQIETRLDALEGLLEQHLLAEDLGWQTSQTACPIQLSPLTSTQVANCQRTLSDVCNRLRGARLPVAAINGIGIVVDIDLATASEAAARQCGAAIHSDLMQIRASLGLHAPFSLIMTGLERHPGTTEAIRRLGAQRANQHALGATVDPREVCDRQRAGAIVDTALGSLTQAVQGLMSEPNALSSPGNSQLLKLLIYTRQRMVRPLQVLLAQVLPPSSGDAATQPSYFNGLFFTASGPRPVEQGFTAPVFERIHAQQHWLSWTATEQKAQHRQRAAIAGLMLLSLAELIGLGVQWWR